MMKAKFAYFGTPYVARDTLSELVQAGYVPEVVVTSPDAPQGRGLALAPCETKAWALAHGLPVLTPAVLDGPFIQELSAYECQYGIAVAYGKIVPQALLDAFPKGILNVHYSLLPKYRGASPVEAALWNGDTETGVTIQQMALQLDAGDILAQREVGIEPNDTTLTLRPRLIKAGAELLIETLPEFIAGTLSPVAQDESLATHARKIRKEEGRISLKADGFANWNTYRAFRESPGIHFFAEKDGKRIRVKITDAKYEDGRFIVLRIIPEGKSEQDAAWLSQAGWTEA